MEENHIKIKGHVFGPQTVKIEKWFQEYKAGLEKPYTLEDNQIEVYFNFNLKVVRRNEQVENALEIICKMFEHHEGHRMDISYNYDRSSGLVTIQSILRMEKKEIGLKGIDIPESLEGVL